MYREAPKRDQKQIRHVLHKFIETMNIMKSSNNHCFDNWLKSAGWIGQIKQII